MLKLDNMDPDSIKPAGLPSADHLATPPADPMLTPKLPSTEETPEPVEDDKPAKKPEVPSKPPKTKKSSGQNVALAIFATVIIVLGIAALAVYAYLKQH